MSYRSRTIIFILAFSVFWASCEQKKEQAAPKNIILMISDGCGYNQIEMTSLFQYGETGHQAYEKFPVQLAVRTSSASGTMYDPQKALKTFEYLLDKPTDSGAGATAMACGIKTYNNAIAVDVDSNAVQTIIERAEELGKATGVVTSVPFSHATPAAFVAHNISRKNHETIADYMINQSAVDVIMGCVYPFLNESCQPLDAPIYVKVGGKETWEGLLAGSAGTDADNDGVADPWTLIQDQAEFQKYGAGDTPKRVIGIPKVGESLQVHRKGKPDAAPFETSYNKNVPTLVEMSRVALNVLDKNENGFFVMIEGGAIDWAGHDNNAARLVEEETDFNQTVQAVVDWVNKNSNWDETLIIVTADHETGYLNGPGSGQEQPFWRELVNHGKGKMPGYKWFSGQHSNSLIPLFAKGNGANELVAKAVNEDSVRGKFLDNNEIGQVMFALWSQERTK